MITFHQVTTIETKALCSVLRAAESQGERSLVEKMIEICDPQSGLSFGELWDWWKSHKKQDANKSDYRFQPHQQILSLRSDPNKITITC